MNSQIKKLIKSAIGMALILSVNAAKAQNPVKDILDRLASYKNFGYQHLYKQKDDTGDTLVQKSTDIFLREPEDKLIGYFFTSEYIINGWKFPSTDIYDGQNLITYSPLDSVYQIHKTIIIAGNLLNSLNWINNYLTKYPSKISTGKDTVINSVPCSHLIVTSRDTIINGEHLFAYQNIYVDKVSGLPNTLIIRARSDKYGDGITNSYNENHYFDYKFNREDVSLSTFTIPKGYHPPQKSATPANTLLAPGSIAPDWTLSDTNGKKVSLRDLRGKVVLLDFYFIGCIPCMQSIKPLNNLYKKYKGKEVVIASVTERDSEKDVLAFKKRYGIEYSGYVGAADAVKSFHVTAAPTFYIIDQDGKIANAHEGYSDEFETNTAAMIDSLLKRKQIK